MYSITPAYGHASMAAIACITVTYFGPKLHPTEPNVKNGVNYGHASSPYSGQPIRDQSAVEVLYNGQ